MALLIKAKARRRETYPALEVWSQIFRISRSQDQEYSVLGENSKHQGYSDPIWFCVWRTCMKSFLRERSSSVSGLFIWHENNPLVNHGTQPSWHDMKDASSRARACITNAYLTSTQKYRHVFRWRLRPYPNSYYQSASLWNLASWVRLVTFNFVLCEVRASKSSSIMLIDSCVLYWSSLIFWSLIERSLLGPFQNTSCNRSRIEAMSHVTWLSVESGDGLLFRSQPILLKFILHPT
jgi:hypothetical protein